MATEDNELEYSLKYKDTSEYESLYSWSIDEVNKDGKVVNENLIPWDWSISFKVSFVSYVSEQEIHDAEKIDTEALSAELKQLDDDEPLLEIFGTSKPIEEFSLVIYKASQKDDNSESLRASASGEYEFEIDFRTQTSPSYLQFELFLVDEKFDELKELVKKNRASSIQLRISHCKGLYSYWSPSISTHQIKILTYSHKIELPEGREDLWRLGDVERYTFSYISRQDLVTIPETNEEEEIDEHFEDEPVTTREQYIQEKTNSELQSINSSLNKAKYFAVAIVLLLFFIWWGAS